MHVTLEAMLAEEKIRLTFSRDLCDLSVEFGGSAQVEVLHDSQGEATPHSQDDASPLARQSVTLFTKDLYKALLQCLSFVPNAVIFGICRHEALVVYVHWEPIITTYVLPHINVEGDERSRE
jgi:hypothetical protein